MGIDTKHTPGPWTFIGPSPGGTACDDGGDYAIIQRGGVIAEAIHRINKTRYEDAKANAHLIVAAPDMLEALEAEEHAQCLDEEYGRTARLLPQDERVEKWRDVEAARHHAGKLRTAAIAKAKGQTP